MSENKKKPFWEYIEEAINILPKLKDKPIIVVEGCIYYLEPLFKKCTLPEEEQG